MHIMGDHNNRYPFFIQPTKEFHDLCIMAKILSRSRLIQNEKGVTVVMITHDMHLMLEYTPRALVFADGRLIADRSAAAVLCDPQLIRLAALKETSLFTLADNSTLS